MDKAVRWGLLSTARINRRLIPVIGSSAYSELAAVASRDGSRAAAYAGEWGIPKAYGEYDELLRDPDIDVIYNPLPNHLHAEWTIRALEAGKHVLCEKPLCLSLDEMDEIAQARTRTGKVVAEALMYQHHPQTEKIGEIVHSGRIGTLRTITSNFCFTLDRDPLNYRLQPEMGGGCLWDVGVYPVSLFQYITGNGPGRVWGLAKGDSVDMHFWGMLEYPSGVTGQFYASFDAAFSTHTRFVGSKGVLAVTHPFVNTDACRAAIVNDSGVEELKLPSELLYQGEVEDMNAVVLEGRQPRITLESSRMRIETILRLREASRLRL